MEENEKRDINMVAMEVIMNAGDGRDKIDEALAAMAEGGRGPATSDFARLITKQIRDTEGTFDVHVPHNAASKEMVEDMKAHPENWELPKRYGMIYVDQDDYGKGTGKRLRKKSFYYYKKLVASNGADLENDVTIPEE